MCDLTQPEPRMAGAWLNTPGGRPVSGGTVRDATSPAPRSCRHGHKHLSLGGLSSLIAPSITPERVAPGCDRKPLHHIKVETLSGGFNSDKLAKNHYIEMKQSSS